MEAVKALKSLQPRQQKALLENMIANLEPSARGMVLGQLVDALEQEKARRYDLKKQTQEIITAAGGSAVAGTLLTLMIGIPIAISEGGPITDYLGLPGTLAFIGAAAGICLPISHIAYHLPIKAVERQIECVKHITPADSGDAQAGQVQGHYSR